MTNIVICGGHLSPALAVIETLKKKQKYKIFYFGRKYALEGDRAQSLEYDVIRKLNINFEEIVTGRLQRFISIYSIISLVKFPIGLFQSFYLLAKIRPKLVLSFGGYVALPICLAAWVMQIPIITHEQTYFLGLANKIIARLSKVLLLSFPDTKGVPAKVKTVYTGNPIRQSIFAETAKKLVDFGDRKLPFIYITGGNLGSRAINECVGKIVPQLTARFRILHQCGNADNLKDYKYLSKIKKSLPENQLVNYEVTAQIDPNSVGTIYKNAHLLVGRAGANTVNEILTFGITSILIPLPWAGGGEQDKNAMLVKSTGLGEVISQSQLTPQFLLTTIDRISGSKKYQVGKSKYGIDSTGKIIKLLESYCA